MNSETALPKALQTLHSLRASGINSEIWLDPTTKLEKQLKYTDVKGIQYAVVAGLMPTEGADEVILKNLHARTQETVKIADLPGKINTAKY